MNRASLPALTWATVFAALMSALLLTATDGSVADAESVTGTIAHEALDTLVEQQPPAAGPREPPEVPRYER